MLKDILESKKCFKLVCGAGNEDTDEVEKLVAVYALAGANYFDLSAKPEIVQAAQRGLDRVIPVDQLHNYHLNISVGIKGDPHISKAFINQGDCKRCGKCADVCKIQNAIQLVDISSNPSIKLCYLTVDDKKCIGCGHCKEVCKSNAITMNSETKPIQEILNSLPLGQLSSIELHANSKNKEEIYTQWGNLQKGYSGILSLCLDRSLMGDIELIEFIKFLIKDRKPYTTIIQADGCPMGGTDNEPSTTLQALAIAQIVQKANLPVYLLLSGGTNAETTHLSRLFDIRAHGVAIGSYARMIVKEYIDHPDFWEDELVRCKAFEIAKNLVFKSLFYLGENK